MDDRVPNTNQVTGDDFREFTWSLVPFWTLTWSSHCDGRSQLQKQTLEAFGRFQTYRKSV